ncbi:hypothetical protein SDC9_154706 [bioreactor metagenome]|uniref:Uncharacterized protein n=1 Tax=bioreactor metagenome TaxID=1076179 RepID=A0A645F186_9ZZZZ
MLIDDILQYFQENFSQYLIYVYQHLGLSIQAIGISCLSVFRWDTSATSTGNSAR